MEVHLVLLLFLFLGWKEDVTLIAILAHKRQEQRTQSNKSEFCSSTALRGMPRQLCCRCFLSNMTRYGRVPKAPPSQVNSVQSKG